MPSVKGRPRPGSAPDVTPKPDANRSGRTNGGGVGGGPIHRGGGGFEEVPWRRWVIIGGILVALFVVLGLLGGAVTLITDVMWYDELGRRDILTDAPVGADPPVRHRLRGDARARAA